MQSTDFSTTVAGKRYSGSVQESQGEYTASVSGLAGASATGTSIQAAENNLTTRINELV
jgi:predicted RNase H-like HicB family nuclease